MVMKLDPYYYAGMKTSPDPISFGMSNDPSQSMALTPGAGNLQFGGSVGDSGSGTSGGSIPSGWTPNSSLSVTNLAPVHVSAATLSGSPWSSGLYSGGGQPSMSAPGPGGMQVKDLAPVHVTAQVPRQPSLMDRAWMWGNDHPLASGLIKNTLGAVTPLGPVIVAANAYEKYKHGQPLIGNMFGNLGSALSGMFKDSPGGPLSSNAQNPLYKDLYGNGISGSGATSGGIMQGMDGQLPNYPGLASLSAVPASLPGGYWNQRALHDAAPTYGPFAGFGSKPLPIAPTGIFGT